MFCFQVQRKNGTMVDSSSDHSTCTSAATITPKQAQALPHDSPSSPSSTSQQQKQPVQLQQSLPLTATLLDVPQLDDYLLRLVLSKLQQVLHGGSESSNTVDTTSSKASWLWPALQLITLWVTQGQTPGVRLLGLRVDTSAGPNNAATGGNTSASDDLASRLKNSLTNNRIGLLRYSVLGILVPFLYQKLKDWKMSVEVQQQQQSQRQVNSPDGNMSSSDTQPTPTRQQQQEQQQHLAIQRRLQVARLLIRAVDTMLPGVKLVLLLTCWTGNGTGTDGFCLPWQQHQQQQQQHQQQHVLPNNIAARLCQWKYHTAPSQSQPEGPQQQPGQQQQQNRLHVDFAHRRWLYESLLQTSRIWWAGLFLLAPVWGQDVQDYMVSPVTRCVQDLSSRVATAAQTVTALVFWRKTNTMSDGQQQRRPQYRSCPICRRTDPPTVPVQGNCASGCRQIYCYACLYTAAVRARRVYCRTCRNVITVCRFVALDSASSDSSASIANV
jgi:hypothetical protein